MVIWNPLDSAKAFYIHSRTSVFSGMSRVSHGNHLVWRSQIQHMWSRRDLLPKRETEDFGPQRKIVTKYSVCNFCWQILKGCILNYGLLMDLRYVMTLSSLRGFNTIWRRMVVSIHTI
jgi:hypothetical protein